MVLISMCVGYFLVLLDVTIVNVALPHIGQGLHAGVSALQWVVDGYALALAALMLVGGTIGDRHGHKRVVLSGLAAFGLASLGCGLAPGIGVLVALRALQGIGAALMLPGTLAVITHAYPQGRARAIGTWAAVGSIALPAGPLLGGALVELISWRAIFFLNVPIAAAAFAAAVRTVQESGELRAERLDLAGAGFGALTLAAVTFAFIEGGHSGVHAAVGVAGVLAVTTGCAFVAVERTRDHPMLPLSLFRRTSFSVANAVAGTMNLVTLGVLFIVTLYLQDVRHHSPLVAGVALLPLFAPLSVIAPISGRLTARRGPGRPMITGLLVSSAGLALLALAGRDTTYLLLVPALLLWGAGLGVLTPAVVAAAVGSLPTGRAGLASAVNNAARQAGGAIGIAGFGALAGSPAGGAFLAGLHVAALVGAGLFLAAVLATLAWIE